MWILGKVDHEGEKFGRQPYYIELYSKWLVGSNPWVLWSKVFCTEFSFQMRPSDSILIRGDPGWWTKQNYPNTKPTQTILQIIWNGRKKLDFVIWMVLTCFSNKWRFSILVPVNFILSIFLDSLNRHITGST